jgi:hypothetical protein
MNKNNLTDFLSADKVILYLLGVVFLMTFSHFIFTGFATCDDYGFYCRYFNDTAIWKNSYKIATEHGRFYFSFMMPTFTIYGPFLFGSYLASRIITLFFIIAGVFVFAKTLKTFVKNTSLSYLFLLVYVVFICIKTRNTPLTGFPLYFSFSWFLLQCSFYYYLKYIQLNVKKYLILSIALYGCTMLFYEMYLLFIVIFFILHLFFKYDQSKPLVYLRETLSVNYPFLILAFCYCSIYLIFKIKFSQELYSGVQVSEKSPLLASFNTIWQLTVGAFPRLYFSSMAYENNSYILGGHTQGILNPILNIKFEWLLKSFFIGTVFLLIIKKLDPKPLLKPFQLKVTFLLLILMLFLPNVLLSVTKKYQEYTKEGSYYYLTTYFASFAVYTFIAILIYFLLSHHNTLIRKLSKWVILVVLMLFSILTDYANHHAEKDLNRIYRLFDHVDGFLKSSAVNKFNTDSSEILSPELYSYHSSLSYYNDCGNFSWSPYFKGKTGKVLHVVPTTDSILVNKRPGRYRLVYEQFIDGHAFILSSYKTDSIRYLTLYIRSTKKAALVNYLKEGSIKTEKIELPEKSQYNVIELPKELLKSDSVWVSDIVY